VNEHVSSSEPSDRPIIPVEIEIYLNPDGSVTFADLEEHAIDLARELDPDAVLACDITPQDASSAPEESDRAQAAPD
jgi:hypothetical protein